MNEYGLIQRTDGPTKTAAYSRQLKRWKTNEEFNLLLKDSLVTDWLITKCKLSPCDLCARWLSVARLAQSEIEATKLFSDSTNYTVKARL